MDNFIPITSDTIPKEKKDIDEMINTMKDLSITDSQQLIIESNTKIKPTNDKSKCNLSTCKKRLTITETLVICNCGNTYCTKHRHSKEHACEFNYKNNKNQQQHQLVNARFEKLNKI